MIRDAVLDTLVGALTDDPVVVGVALVGSLGRGDADEWSDIDILVVTTDGSVPAALVEGAVAIVDAAVNVRVGASSGALVFERDGEQLPVDWYVHPPATAAWPSDSAIVFDRGAIPSTDETFEVWNGHGERGVSAPSDPAAIELMWTLIDAKRAARAQRESRKRR